MRAKKLMILVSLVLIAGCGTPDNGSLDQLKGDGCGSSGVTGIVLVDFSGKADNEVPSSVQIYHGRDVLDPIPEDGKYAQQEVEYSSQSAEVEVPLDYGCRVLTLDFDSPQSGESLGENPSLMSGVAVSLQMETGYIDIDQWAMRDNGHGGRSFASWVCWSKDSNEINSREYDGENLVSGGESATANQLTVTSLFTEGHPYTFWLVSMDIANLYAFESVAGSSLLSRGPVTLEDGRWYTLVVNYKLDAGNWATGQYAWEDGNGIYEDRLSWLTLQLSLDGAVKTVDLAMFSWISNGNQSGGGNLAIDLMAKDGILHLKTHPQ